MPESANVLERRGRPTVVCGVDQIRGGGIGEGVRHLVEDVDGLDQMNDGSRFGGPEVLEAAEVGVLAAREKV